MKSAAGLSIGYSRSSIDSTINMAKTPGDFPHDDPPPAASGSDIAQDAKFKFVWQELSQVGRFVRENGWQQGQIPIILETLPENLVLSQPLRDILLWSLQRPEERITEVSEAISPAKEQGSTENTNTVKDNPPIEHHSNETLAITPKVDGSERSTTSSKTKMRRENPLLSRLKQLRQDVAAKIASRGQHVSGTSSTTTEVVEDIPQNAECISCFDEHPKGDLVHLACSHHYCKPCAGEVILNAIKTESAFPPKCCLTEIPLKTVLVCLDNKQRDEYKDKTAEYAIPAGHRWYCPEPKCGKWIRPENLHRERRSHQTCPHCKTKICSICRSVAHDENQDCPQDFGLESMLEVAEFEGWRRCYSCRTMVELTTGCRHITCRCGAEFCYVCNARWRTCNCSEADKLRRIEELRTRRQERDQQQQEEDAAAQAEAQEIADAIAQIEEMERQEAIRLAEEEVQRQLEEELMLARLEEARLLEEIARREAEDAAEVQFRQILVESSKEECQALMSTLMQIINFQHAALMSHHAAQEHDCLEKRETQQAMALEESSTMAEWLQENIARRTQALHNKQQEEWERLLRQAEQEEDDMFMQMHMYLRDKPNREQREKRMRDTLHQQQHEKQEILQKKHQGESYRLELGIYYENEGLQRAQSNRLEPMEEQVQLSLRELGWHIGCDRRWFQLVSTRRIEMLKEHRKLVLEQLEAEQDLVGLAEEQARNIGPALPATSEGQHEPSHMDGVEGQEITQLAYSEPTQPPPPVPYETADLYNSPDRGVPENSTTPVQQTFSPPKPHSMTTFNVNNQLNRSGTVIRPIPGAYPPSTNATSSSKGVRSTHQNTFPTRTEQPAAGSKPVNGALSMSDMTAMSFMVSAHNNRTRRKDSGSTSTSPSMSLTSTTTTDTRRTSKTSATSESGDAELLDSICANVVARGASSSGSGLGLSLTETRSGKARKSIFGNFGNFGRKKEMSEEEIKRRLSGCVGDGFGV